MSVKLKMMLLMGSLITIVVLMISVVGFINFKSESVNTYDRGLKNDAMVIGKAVEQKIGRTFDVLHAVAAELAITSDEKIDEVATLKSLKSIADNFDVLGAHIGMKNGDIYATLLNISIGTSKSQLFKARKMLQDNIKTLNTKGYGTK